MRCPPYTNTTWDLKGWCAVRTLQKPTFAARMVGGAHPTKIRPPRVRIHEQSCVVTTLHKHSLRSRNGARCAPYLHKPYLCIPQIARMVGGAHPTTIRPPRARIHEQSCAVRTLHKHSLRGRNFKKGWCAVRTLHKPYLCIPQQGWWAVPTLRSADKQKKQG